MNEDAEMGIEVAELGKTFQDAIIILRHLEIRYVWVHKLCINWITQSEDDSEDNSFRETAKLAQYVANAALVIKPECTRMQMASFKKGRLPATFLELNCFLQNAKNIQTGMLGFREPLRSAAEILSDFLSSRACMFQEISLPKREIIYSSDQVYRKCRTVVKSKGSLLSLLAPVDFPPFAVYEGTDAELFHRW